MLVQRLNSQAVEELDDKVAIELFLRESNAIEGVYNKKSLKQAITAWLYLVGQDTLTGGVILKTHKVLMLHQPLMPNEKGYWRQCAVWVGVREGIPHKLIPSAISDWLELGKKTHTAVFLEEWIKQLHIQYEVIHPFVDGNGRTGRMFMNWQRLKVGLPLLVIEEEEKQSYYDWFRS